MRRSVLAALLLVVAFAVPVHGAPKPCTDHQPCPPPAPVAMGRLATSGFEANDAGIDAFGASVVVSATARTGANALDVATGFGDFVFAGATARNYYGRIYFRPTAAPASSSSVLLNIVNSTSSGLEVLYQTDGSLLLVNAAGSSIGASASSPLVLNNWYRIEVNLKINTGSNDDTAELRVDGATVYSTTTANLGTLAPTDFGVAIGMTAGAAGAIDDVALNDDQGANQNSWPGEGKVVLLVPTADSAKGTGWTNDAAGASNFFDAVDNKPPVGIADTTAGSGLHQIRNATANANSNYDATMTTYAAAGLAQPDTINVIDPIVATGAPVVTSAKAGTVGVVSNPTIANVSLGAGGTAGAFWSGVAAGTYPTGWKISHGTLTYAPSVTVGTAPVMRVTQVTSSTRIAIVCFMAMYVDYTPGILPYVNPMPPMIAQ